jgi:hypothetical protein
MARMSMLHFFLYDSKALGKTCSEELASLLELLNIAPQSATLHITCLHVPTDSISRQVLQPAKDVVRSRDQFKQRLQSFLKKNRGNAEPPKTKQDLEKEIAKYQDYNGLKTEAITALNAAVRVNSTYNREREGGGKKVGRVAQEFVNSFSEFLGVYSGIVNLVKGAGQIYGEVAYETLSVLFIVCFPRYLNEGDVLSF